MLRHRNRRALFASVIAVALAPLAGRIAEPARGETLESLGDNRLMSELAGRGLDSLLDRYFDLHHTPESQQRAIRSLQALQELGDPEKHLTNAERERRVKQVVDGIITTLPTMRDPQQLAADAGTLMVYGITRDQNLLEFWGENPATQARLLPVAQTVYKMLGQASKLATQQANALQAKINPQNQNVVGVQWQKLDDLSHNAEYSQNMVAYDVAIASPRDQRAAVADPAIKFLSDLDNEDSQVQPRVREAIGKLYLTEGKSAEARKYFASLISGKDDTGKDLSPKPDVAQQYDAMYFINVADLQSGDIAAARKGLDALIAWQQTAMPKDKQTQEGVAAAAEMLRYRIDLAEAAGAKDAAARQQAETAATNVLLKLSQNRPDLRGIIYQQLVERLPKDAPVAGMDPLLLQGLMSKAWGETGKPEGQPVDKQVVQRGLDAAAEMTARKDPAITPQMRDDAAKMVPALLEALDKKIDAANAYLKYAQENAAIHPPAAMAALEDAGRVTFDLRRTDRDDPRVADLYDRFLPVAIAPPFNKTQLAFAYAQRLDAVNKPQEALKFFRLVPKSDRNYASAQYYQLEALAGILANPKLPEAERVITTNDLVRQAEQVRQLYAGNADPMARERAGIATLSEAKAVGVEQKKPQQTLQLLNGFETAVQGTPDEKILVGDALLTRVNAHMAMGQLQQATDMLVALLNHTGGAQGAEYVRGLLDRLDKDLDKAEASKDAKAMADISKSEANLSGFLVQWARNNPNAEIKRYTYQYMVFDARTKRLAGAFAQTPADRKKLLTDAMAAYRQLQQPPSVAMYKATLDPKKVAGGAIDPNQPDPNVELGVALANYELQDYKDAGEMLGTLLNTGKLGGPTLVTRDAAGNDEKVTDNDVYWEATYKLYRSNAAEAKGSDEAALAPTKQGLKNLLIRGGIPAKWQDRFESLRKDIIPDFSVAALATTAPAATQPITRR